MSSDAQEMGELGRARNGGMLMRYGLRAPSVSRNGAAGHRAGLPGPFRRTETHPLSRLNGDAPGVRLRRVRRLPGPFTAMPSLRKDRR